MYNDCQVPLVPEAPALQFEHALALFLRGLKIAPDLEGLQGGVTKCRKSILSKVRSIGSNHRWKGYRECTAG